jgi:uncharacterized membrane protein YagU involved in acid resistance
MSDVTREREKGRPRAFDTIVWGGLVAGVLDAIDGVVAFGFKGMNPIQVLQYIASGLLGPDSFKGGLRTAALGAGLHFFIAFVVAAVYYAASLKLSALYRQAATWGLLYGVAVYLFMNYLVLPLSAVAKSQFSLALFLNGILGHAIFVGFTIAWFAHRSGKIV